MLRKIHLDIGTLFTKIATYSRESIGSGIWFWEHIFIDLHHKIPLVWVIKDTLWWWLESNGEEDEEDMDEYKSLTLNREK